MHRYRLIEQVARRIHQKHKNLMSYDSIYQFVKRELVSKPTIDSALLDSIEKKLKTAITSAGTADMSPRNYGRINPAFLQAHAKFS